MVDSQRTIYWKRGWKTTIFIFGKSNLAADLPFQAQLLINSGQWFTILHFKWKCFFFLFGVNNRLLCWPLKELCHHQSKFSSQFILIFIFLPLHRLSYILHQSRVLIQKHFNVVLSLHLQNAVCVETNRGKNNNYITNYGTFPFIYKVKSLSAGEEREKKKVIKNRYLMTRLHVDNDSS